ncbi:MAG TPA: acyltransferase domain-containing protein [Pseudonocardiaceae bacterium]|nr:acyltransferase domain-containing protein [Pseudonocardiaceae bacterium]
MSQLVTQSPSTIGVRSRILAWAAQDATASAGLRATLAGLLDDISPAEFPDFARSFATVHGRGVVRDAVVAATPADAATALRAGRTVRATAKPTGRPVAMMFPGQGSQHRHMALGLYRGDPAFARIVDEVLDLFGPLGEQVHADWLADRPHTDIDDVTRAQPLLFAVDYALGRWVLDWGVRPAALIGHSVGEFAAATVAGVFDLPDAVRLMADRVARIALTPPGGMLAVRAAAAELTTFLRADVVVAAVNGPRQTLLAGSSGPLADVARDIGAAGLLCRAAKATSAFHSPAVADASAASVPTYAGMPMRRPAIPLYSAYTGVPLTEQTASDVAFWAGQPAAPVYFGPALARLLADGPFLLVEAGPAQGLTALAKGHQAVASGNSDVTTLLPARRRTDDDDLRAALGAAARLWVEGHPVRWGDLPTRTRSNP